MHAQEEIPSGGGNCDGRNPKSLHYPLFEVDYLHSGEIVQTHLSCH